MIAGETRGKAGRPPAAQRWRSPSAARWRSRSGRRSGACGPLDDPHGTPCRARRAPRRQGSATGSAHGRRRARRLTRFEECRPRGTGRRPGVPRCDIPGAPPDSTSAHERLLRSLVLDDQKLGIPHRQPEGALRHGFGRFCPGWNRAAAAGLSRRRAVAPRPAERRAVSTRTDGPSHLAVRDRRRSQE